MNFIRSKPFIAAMFFLSSTAMVFAAQPKFSITPLTPTTVFVPVNSTATVQYLVTNKTKVTRVLTMRSINGVTQTTTGNNVCGSSFTLASQQSCILNLQINGNQIAEQVVGGPEVCKTQGNGNNAPDPFLCSQPEQNNTLNITRQPLANATISISPTALTLFANGTNGIITVTNTSTNNVLANNIAANLKGTALEGVVQQNAVNCTSLAPGQSCNLIFTAGTTAVPLTSVPIQGSNTITATANISELLPLAYIASAIAPDGYITGCEISPINGNFVNCAKENTPNLGNPIAIAINPAKTRAYITQTSANNVLTCAINQSTGRLENCVNANASLLMSPRGIALNSAGTLAYIANSSNSAPNGRKVIFCQINQTTGLFSDCSAAYSGLPLSNAQGIVFQENATVGETFAYITNNIGPILSLKCTVDTNTGAFTTCVDAGATLLLAPRLLNIHPTQPFVYIPNVVGTVTQCSIAAATGNLENCNDANGATNIGILESIIFIPQVPAVAYISSNNTPATVFKCSLNENTGQIEACVDMQVPNLQSTFGMANLTLGG